jgi:Domain of unknown function (DUF1929)
MPHGRCVLISGVASCLLPVGLTLWLSLLMPTAMGQANVTGLWGTAPNLMPINPIHVALLPNGKILIVAGSGSCPPSQPGCPSGAPYGPSNHSGASLWDPASQTYTQWFTLSWDMFCNGMVLLQDGRAFIAGGSISYAPFTGQPKTSIFNPSTNIFTNGPNMAHGRWYPGLLTLGDGRVMTFSGDNETGATNTAVEFYKIGSGWSTQYVAPWTPDLYPRMHLLPSGKVFYSGAQTVSKLFDPSTKTWNMSVATTNYGNTRRYGTSVLLPLAPGENPDAKVIIMGGHNPATNTTEIIDMGVSTPAWVNGPNMSRARIEMNAVILPNGKVLAVGGSANDEDIRTASYTADLYDPVHNIFSSAGANAYPRLYHSVALLLPDATVWLAGGNPSPGIYTHRIEIYKPAYLFNSSGVLATRPLISSVPTSISYGTTFTLSTPDAATMPATRGVVLVRNGTVTHAFGMDQREVQLAYSVGSGSLTVTVPSNRSVVPPGYYMLFILNRSGVPSVAKFVRVTAATGSADFSVTGSPSSQSVPRGTRTTYIVHVAPSNGYSGTVRLSLTGLPAGATYSFSPTSISASGSSTLAVSTSGSIATGTYSLTITATDGTLSHTAKVALAETDFSISVSASGLTVRRGSQSTDLVTVTALGPFAVIFSVSGLPKRTSASFSPPSVSGSGASRLTIAAGKAAHTGSYQLTITGTGGGVTRSKMVTLTIQ